MTSLFTVCVCQWPACPLYVFIFIKPASPRYMFTYSIISFSAVHIYLRPPFPHMHLPMASLSTAWRIRDMDWMVLAYTAPSSSFTFHLRKCQFTLLLGSNNMIDAAGETWLISGIQICQLYLHYSTLGWKILQKPELWLELTPQSGTRTYTKVRTVNTVRLFLLQKVHFCT